MPTDPGVAVATQTRRTPPPPQPTTVAPKGQSPQGPAPLPQTPKPAGPLELPHPALQAAGINSGIQAFNAKVQQIDAAHQLAYGQPPTPGLTLDVARSDVDPQHYNALFSVPKDPAVARAQATIVQHKTANPFDYFVTRPDGVIQPNNPLYQLAHNTPLPSDKPETRQQLLKKYPMVTEGALPVSAAVQSEIFGALSYLNRPDKTTAAPSPDVNAEAKYAFGPQSANTPGSVGDEQYKLVQTQRGISGMRAAQTELNKQMGTQLPVTGVMNDSWVKALSNWTRTADYFRKQLAFQANDAGFGMNVGAYERAWHAKQKAVSHGLVGQFLAAMPLPLFGHGSVWDDLASLPAYLKGTSNNPLNIGLHGLTRTAGLALDTVSGTVSQAKADAAAATTFAAYMTGLHGKSLTYDEAISRARDQLHANPSWLRMLGAGFVPVHEGRVLSGIDQFTNVAGDLILMRRPVFTGERVASGDLASAVKSTYLGRASGWAFQDLAKYGTDGIGRAASRLESAPGGRALVARAAPLIKNGTMTQEQFTQHVAELYATGSTTLTLPARLPRAIIGDSPYAHRTDEWIRQRLGVLTDKYNKFVDELGLAEGRAGDYKTTTAYQNMYAKKLARKGIVQPTVKQQLRGLAESKLLRLLESRPDEPVVQRIVAEIDEAAALGKELSLRNDAALGVSDVPQTVSSVPGEPIKVTVSGAVLPSMQSAKLPTPGKTSQWLQEQRHGLRDYLDTFDATAKGSNSGLVNRAGAIVQTVRSAVAHAAPQGARLGYFQDILPERVFNFVVKHQLGDDTYALANKLESDLVRFQGKENVRGVQSVEQQIRKLYHEKYGRAGTDLKDDPFAPLLETEAPSVFKFPGGNESRPEEAFAQIGGFTARVNAGFNKAARIHARIILSGANPLTGLGGFSLFWKHSIGDGLRAVVGGIGSALTPEVKAAQKEIEALARSNPEIARRYGALLDRLRTGETAWALNRGGWNISTEDFRTGNKLASKAHLDAAGEFLRRQLDSKAMQARAEGRLTQLVATDKTFKALWRTAQKTNPTLTEQDYAALIEQRYKEIGDALTAKGLTFDDAAAVLRANAGHDAGPALGQWVKENSVDFPVYHPQVETRGTFDDLTGRWVGNVIMRPNKFWRKSLGETILAKHYSILRGQGFDERAAFDVASTVAERVTKYHMLDFANRLQVEQDLRWLSYFATKHRLYWKWVLSTFTRHPGYAAAVVDFKDTLNKTGGVSLPFTLLGQKWQIPLERLVWVPGREYDETAPLAVGVFNLVKSGGNLDAAIKGATGTQGNILTRSDTATFLGTKLLKINAGLEGATYEYARAGLDKQTGDKVWRAINEYQVEHFKLYGHYAPESAAVKTVLLHQLGQEYWRANLPLPVVPDVNRTDQQQLLAQYMSLIDPKARAKFLNDHPGFSDHFGVYTNPEQYLHNRDYYGRWAKALDAYHSARRDLYATAAKQGEWTVPLEQKRRDLNSALQKTRDQLLIDDARSNGIDTKGGVPNGTTIKYGPWGRVVNKDPQFDPSHFLSALFPKLHAAGEIVGPLQKSLQNQLALLNDPSYVRANVQTPEEIKTLKREILQKLEVFKSYPSDALGKVRDTYQTAYVNKYWAAYDAKVNAIKNMPSGERAADSAFRAWRDQQDKQVTVGGIKFPAPLRMAWATLDPKTRQERLSYLASKPLTSLADYELDLLDVKHPANVSEALAAIDKAKQEYRAQYPGHSINRAQLLNVAKSINKQRGYEGFYPYYVNQLQAPRIYQFEATGLYRGMPQSVKAKFDQVIAQQAIAIAAGIKAHKAASYYKQEWRKAVQTQIVPWLADPSNKDLRDYLAPFGPNFLGDLPG